MVGPASRNVLMCPYASCSDCCIVQCWSWSVVVVVVVECCCYIPYRLALLLVLTFAPSVLTFAPCTLTFAPCACGVIFLSISASTPLSHMVVVTGCNLLVAFFLQPLAQTLLAPVVVTPIATCAGGLFPSTHWRTYSTGARATCTVWWWSVVVVVTCGSGGGGLYIYIYILYIYKLI